jgi:hypothetical protein
MNPKNARANAFFTKGKRVVQKVEFVSFLKEK